MGWTGCSPPLPHGLQEAAKAKGGSRSLGQGTQEPDLLHPRAHTSLPAPHPTRQWVLATVAFLRRKDLMSGPKQRKNQAVALRSIPEALTFKAGLLLNPTAST